MWDGMIFIPYKGELFFDTLHPLCKGQYYIAKAIFDYMVSYKIIDFK